MDNLDIILPEILFFIGICTSLMVGVFLKNSFQIVMKLSILILLVTIYLILNDWGGEQRVFLDAFINDKFSDYFKILILISSIFVFVSSSEFIKEKKLFKFEYPVIIMFSILGMFFMLSSNDLILFYLGLELQSLALYVLAAIDRDNTISSEAGIKYFVLSALSSGLLLYGCSLLYGFTGTTNFELISYSLNAENIGAIFAMVFILVGLAFKVSAVPFHMWTPDVYQGAPTSITNFFAVVPKAVGLAMIIRFMNLPFKNILDEWQIIIIFISIASMILGSVAAIGQKNIKRFLAYSSISHMGYALAGVATGTSSGYTSTIVYITIYAIMNIGTFACLYLMKVNGKYTEEIGDLSGLSKQKPLFAFAFLILFFSLAGIPPLGGFFAKFFVFMSVIESELYALAIIGLLTTVISAFYYLKVIKIIYFDNNKIKFDEVRNVSVKTTIFLSCLILSLYFISPSIINSLLNGLFI